MRKGLVVLLAAVVVAMLAAPAMAGMEASGFYRSKAYVSNFKTNSATSPQIGKDVPAAGYVEQRLRIKFAFGEENVKVVWFSEIDYAAWGDAAGSTVFANKAPGGTSGVAGTDNSFNNGGAQRNSGGALGADRINLETKNVYVWFKLPNTSLDFTVGMQNQSDSYAGLFFGAADMAGIFVNGKFDPVAYTLGWAKLYENNTVKADDMTLYLGSAKFSPVKDVRIGLNFYFLQDDTGKVSTQSATNPGQFPFDPASSLGLGALNKKQVYVPGVDFTFKAGPATVTGFFLYEGGKIDFLAPAIQDITIKGFAGDLRAEANLGPGKFFIEGLYVSGGDGTGNDYKSIITLSDVNASPGGNSFYARTDMSILLSNADDINTNQALIGAASSSTNGGISFGACNTSPGNCGRGITHLAAGYTQKLTDKLTGKVGAGWLQATKLFASDKTSNPKMKKDMGTEVNANLNYNIMKGLDFGVYGAYAWLGDFYKTAAGVSPDNAYDLHARLNYAF